MKRDLGLILFLVLAIGLTLTLNRQDISFSRESVYGSAVDDAVRPLRLERQELEEHKKDLQKQLDSKAAGMGVNVMVFTELREDVCTDAFPKLKKYGYSAVLAFSPEEHPDGESCLSGKDYRALKEAGWTSCLYWDGRGDFEEYLAETDPLFAAVGEERPSVIYFQPGQYRRDFDEELLKAGFTIAIVHGEEETPIIQRSDERDLWRVNSMSWNRVGIKAYVKKIANIGGVFAMHIDFSEQRSGYRSDTFQNMCDYMNLYPNQTLMSPTDARSYRGTLVIDASISAEIEWCDKEIAEINREIREIYEKN